VEDEPVAAGFEPLDSEDDPLEPLPPDVDAEVAALELSAEEPSLAPLDDDEPLRDDEDDRLSVL
jgi:hypothetical protein